MKLLNSISVVALLTACGAYLALQIYIRFFSVYSELGEIMNILTYSVAFSIILSLLSFVGFAILKVKGEKIKFMILKLLLALFPTTHFILS